MPRPPKSSPPQGRPPGRPPARGPGGGAAAKTGKAPFRPKPAPRPAPAPLITGKATPDLTLTRAGAEAVAAKAEAARAERLARDALKQQAARDEAKARRDREKAGLQAMRAAMAKGAKLGGAAADPQDMAPRGRKQARAKREDSVVVTSRRGGRERLVRVGRPPDDTPKD